MLTTTVCLPALHAQPGADRYRQYLLYRDPQARCTAASKRHMIGGWFVPQRRVVTCGTGPLARYVSQELHEWLDPKVEIHMREMALRPGPKRVCRWSPAQTITTFTRQWYLNGIRVSRVKLFALALRHS